MKRITITFWVLVAVAVAATGMLSSSLGEAASPATGLKVGLAGALGAVSIGLALRILVSVSRATHSASGDRDRDRDAGW